MAVMTLALFVGMYVWCAIGLWRLQNWARWLTIVVATLVGVRGFPVLTLAALPIVVYLFSGRTRQAFEGRNRDGARP